MIQLNDAVTIARPTSEVFAFVAAVDKIPQWQSDVVTSKVVTPGLVRVGTRFTEELRMGPSRQTAACEVTEFASDVLIGFTGKAPAIEFHAQYRFEKAASGTRVTVDGKAHLKGWRRLMQPLIKNRFRHAMRTELRTLKSILEDGRSHPV